MGKAGGTIEEKMIKGSLHGNVGVVGHTTHRHGGIGELSLVVDKLLVHATRDGKLAGSLADETSVGVAAANGSPLTAHLPVASKGNDLLEEILAVVTNNLGAQGGLVLIDRGSAGSDVGRLVGPTNTGGAVDGGIGSSVDERTAIGGSGNVSLVENDVGGDDSLDLVHLLGGVTITLDHLDDLANGDGVADVDVDVARVTTASADGEKTALDGHGVKTEQAGEDDGGDLHFEEMDGVWVGLN